MSKKMLIVIVFVTAISLFSLGSINAQLPDSSRAIQLKPSMTLTDPGKNAVFSIVSIDTIISLGIRIDGGVMVMLASCPTPGFQTFANAENLNPVATPSSPSVKKVKGKSLSTPIRVGDSWRSRAADVTVTIQSQNGDTVVLGIRIDGGIVLVCSSVAKELNTLLSEPNKFMLVATKTQESSSY